MASFQAKTGQDRLRMREKKLFLSVPSQFGIFEVLKNSKKIQKTKKHQYGFFSSRNGTRPAENMRKTKIIVPIH